MLDVSGGMQSNNDSLNTQIINSSNSANVEKKATNKKTAAAKGLATSPAKKLRTSKKFNNLMNHTVGGNNNTNNKGIATCAGCDRPILDQYLYTVLDRQWHQKCIQCCDCKQNLSDKCFSRDGKIYCREDFIK